MANESKKPMAVPPALPSAKAGAGNLATSPAAAVSKPVESPAVVAAPAAKPIALFGGHRGGGKKRADGLIAGSPAAIAADKEKNAKRMRDARAAQAQAALPPALPPRAPAVENQVAPPVSSNPAVPLAPADTGLPPVGVVFVPWTTRLLEKPAKLLGKIVERWRSYSRAAQVKKLKLTPAAEKDILERMKWRDDAVNDFSVALADCAAVELNKRRVPGAEHSHWINLVMTGGELVSLELANTAMIEKLILEDKAKQAEAAKGTPEK
jgi:hypothetical protein